MIDTTINLIDEELIAAQIKKHEKTGIDQPLTFGMVIYTDGGCRGRDAGFGIHGYIHCNTPVKTGCGVTGYTATNKGYRVDAEASRGLVNELNIFDSTKPPTEPMVHVQPFLYFDGSGSIQDATNNIAEVTAVIYSLTEIEKFHAKLGIKTVHFKIDSKYVIDGILNRMTIIQNNYHNKTGPIANEKLWIELYSKLEQLAHLDIVWTIEWVKGHSDHFGNIQADRLATMGRTAASNNYDYYNFETQPAQGRWGATAADIKSNPAICFMFDNKWYSDPIMEMETRNDGLQPIFVGTHEDHERAGQPNASTTQAVILMKNPPRHLDRLSAIADKLNNVETGYETRTAFYCNVNTVIKPDFEDMTITHGDGFMIHNTDDKTFLTYDQKEIIRSFNPPLLSIILMNDFMALHTVLDRVVTGELLPDDYLTDVTNLFYSETETNKNKKMMKVKTSTTPSIKAGVKVNVMTKPGEYILKDYNVTLSYGITAPRYRVFGGIKDFNPKIYVLTVYVPSAGFKFYTVAQINTGEWCIWTNPACNFQSL